jgi:hypothetical protein
LPNLSSTSTSVEIVKKARISPAKKQQQQKAVGAVVAAAVEAARGTAIGAVVGGVVGAVVVAVARVVAAAAVGAAVDTAIGAVVGGAEAVALQRRYLHNYLVPISTINKGF